MNQPNYIVFFNESAMFIGNDTGDTTFDKFFEVRCKDDICTLLDKNFGNEKSSDVAIYGYDTTELFRDFCTCFKIVEAAGGLVKNADNQYLFIKRFGIWDLPKGKMEKNEDNQQCAIREVIEETGVQSVSITDKLPETYHIYFRNNQRILKRTYWYSMETASVNPLSPQLNEDITEAVWMSAGKSREALKQSYRSLSDTLLSYISD